MTPEELAAKLAELEAKTARIDELEAKNKELDAKVNPIVPDPDDAYKPKTWKENDDKMNQKAEAAALKVIQDAEKRKDEERKKQEEDIRENEEKIEADFKNLQEDGVIEETKEPNDLGARQRKQILGSLVKSGGQFVDQEAKKLKTAWDAGLEYDYDRNEFVKSGTGSYQARDQFVGSSARQVAAPIDKTKVNTVGLRGDLDEAQRRYEEVHGK